MFFRNALIGIANILLVLSTSTFAADQDFLVVNNTGVEINELYVSPSRVDDWEEDLLNGRPLRHGEDLEITFHRKENAAKWDLKVVDHQGNSITWDDLNLLEISELTLNFKNGRAWSNAK